MNSKKTLKNQPHAKFGHALLVAGMHRSGTSPLTRIINLLGAQLPSNLMPEEEENATGFWESVDIADLNDELLHAAGTGWDDILPVDLNIISEEDRSKFSERAQLLLDRDFSGISWYVLKDPRFARLLAFWVPLLQNRRTYPYVIIPFRHPLEVAASLHRRNGFSQEKGIYMWLRNSVDALRHSNGIHRSIVSYNDLINNWSKTMGQIAIDLDIQWPVDPNTVSDKVDGLLDRKLRHFVQEGNLDSDHLVDQLANQLYLAFCGRDNDIGDLAESIHQTLAPMEETLAPFLRSQAATIDAERMKWWQVIGGLRGKLQRALVNKTDQAELHPLDKLFEIKPDLGNMPTEQLQIVLNKEFGYEQRTRILTGMQLFRLPLDSNRRDLTPSDEELISLAEKVAGLSSNLSISEKPDVSIIIPVFNKAHFTLACIFSCLSATTRYTYELIVADDCSTDMTPALFSQWIPNIRHIRTSRNIGFLKNCNLAAKQAQGNYLVFLNNDTYILPGWLDNLIETLEKDSSIGLVGSKLIFADGQLQEAGGLVFSDGSAWNYGRSDDPCKPCYCYLRDSDYVSGASIALSEKLWRSMGGFDEQYINAYYEDTDLAFRIRESGRRVVVQPLSQIIHFEGITSGTDLQKGVKRYQDINGKTFRQRWAGSLPAYGALNPASLPINRNSKGTILVIDERIPFPDRDSGSMDTYQYLRILTSFGLHVIFASEIFTTHMGRYTSDLQKLGVEVLYSPYWTDFEQILKSIGSSLDYVLVYRAPVAAKILDQIREHAPQAKIIFDTVDLHFLRMEREAALSKSSDRIQLANKMKDVELDLIGKVDATIILSHFEKELVREILPTAALYEIPIVREIPPYSEIGFDDRRDVVFVGGYEHLPNVDAVKWFVAEVFPLLTMKLFDGNFIIVGSNVPPEITDLAKPGIVVRGFVDDLEGVFSKVRLSVAPIRYGAGLKGKVISSMNCGVPVVATSIAVEGGGFIAGESVLVADDAELMAETIMHLYTDKTRWESISRNAYDYSCNNFSVPVIAAKLHNLLTELIPEKELAAGLKDCEIYSKKLLPASTKVSTQVDYITLVKNMYRGFLHRDPEPHTVDNWVSQLNNGLRIDNLVISLLDTKEYANIRERLDTRLWIQLYLGTGTYFLEENSIVIKVREIGEFQEFIFDLSSSKGLHALRLDPLNECAVIEIDSINMVTKYEEVFDLKGLVQSNACSVQGGLFFFDTRDPQFFFEGLAENILSTARNLKISLRYLSTGREAVHTCLLQLSSEKNNQINTLKSDLDSALETTHFLRGEKKVLDQALVSMRQEYALAIGIAAEREAQQTAANMQLISEYELELATLRTNYEVALKDSAERDASQTAAFNHLQMTLNKELATIVRIAAKREVEQQITLEELREAHLIEKTNTVCIIRNWSGYSLLEGISNSR